MPFIVNKDWTTKSGLRAVVIEITQPSMFGESTWHCGYVAVNSKSPLFDKDYGDRVPELEEMFERIKDQDAAGHDIFGSYGAIDLLAMAFDDDEAPRLSYCLQVHGGVTFSKKSREYPVASEEELNWIGFDCNHFDDSWLVQNLEFNTKECERLASQIFYIEKFLTESQDA